MLKIGLVGALCRELSHQPLSKRVQTWAEKCIMRSEQTGLGARQFFAGLSAAVA